MSQVFLQLGQVEVFVFGVFGVMCGEEFICQQVCQQCVVYLVVGGLCIVLVEMFVVLVMNLGVYQYVVWVVVEVVYWFFGVEQ